MNDLEENINPKKVELKLRVKRRFFKEFPSKQKIDKVQLALYQNLWNVRFLM